MNNRRRGDWSEIVAIAWAMDCGYEVFRNQGCTGPADLILFKPTENPTLVDVKTCNPRLRSDGLKHASKLKESQVQLGVKRLWVTRSGRCGLDEGTESIIHDY